MAISIVNSLSEDEWCRFVYQNPVGNIFHTPEMHRVFQAADGYKPELWAAVGDDQKLLAMFLPVRITIKKGFLEILTSRSISFGSILCDQSSDAFEALRILLITYQKESGSNSLFTELRNISPIPEFQQVLNQTQFKYEEHYNFLINLEHSPEDVFSRIGKRAKKNILRNSKKGQVQIEEVNDLTGLNLCYQLLQKTYRRAQVPLADISLFEAAMNQLYPKGMLLAKLARVGSTPAAACFELLYKDVIYGWYMGMDRTYSAYTPNDLLIWDILRWGSENGYRQYDWGGAGKLSEKYGVRDFKAKFGGTLVCFGRNTWVPNPFLLEIAKFGYTLYRKLPIINV